MKTKGDVGDPEIIIELTKQLRSMATKMSSPVVRWMVKIFYEFQEMRIRADSQITAMKAKVKETNSRALDDDEVEGEGHEAMQWFANQMAGIEAQVVKLLDNYAKSTYMGQWAQSIYGIGPILSAGLAAYIRMNPWVCAHTRRAVERAEAKGIGVKVAKKACTPSKPCGPECHHVPIRSAGQIWSFMGIVGPEQVWEEGKMRPWNATLKVLGWKIGQSFVKMSSNPKSEYGQIFLRRKEYEWERNLRGELSCQCEVKLSGPRKVGTDTEAYIWYGGRIKPQEARDYLDELVRIKNQLQAEIAGARLLRDTRIAEIPVDASEADRGAVVTAAIKECKKTEVKAAAAASKARMDYWDSLKSKVMARPISGVRMLPPDHIQSRAERYTVKRFIGRWFEVAYEHTWKEKPPKPFVFSHLGHTHYEAPIEG